MSKKDAPNYEQVKLFIDCIDQLSVEEIKRVIKNYRANANNNAYSNSYAGAYTRAHISDYSKTMVDTYKNAYTQTRAKAYEAIDTIDTNMYATAVSNTALALASRDTISMEDFEILISTCRFLLEELGIVSFPDKGV